MLVGECNCGSVRFELNASPSGVFFCHCSVCRRHTGTNGNAVIIVKNEDFAWHCGENQIATWEKPDQDWQIWFCKTCGSQLPGVNDESTTFVPAGLLNNEKDLRVIHHIWVGSKAAWDEIGDSGKQHIESFQGQ